MLMDSNELKGLLDKYWNCETSLEEEQAASGILYKGRPSRRMEGNGHLVSVLR